MMKAGMVFDAACAVLSGTATQRALIIVGAAVGLCWIAMDVHQYGVMLIDRYSAPAELPFPI